MTEPLFKGSIVALVTPFTQSGEIDYNAVEKLVAWHIEQGTHGLVVAGTTGESATLSLDEQLELTRVTINAASGKIPVIAGCGGIATEKVIQTVKRLNGTGVDGFLCVTPYYIKPTQKGLIKHYTTVADACEAPLILYNVPGRTACDLLNESVAELARHPNIMGIKDAVGDVARSQALFEMVGEAFCYLSGDDETALDFMAKGGHGVISVTANVLPGLMAKWCEAILRDDTKKASSIFEPLKSLHTAMFIEANPIPVKYAVEKVTGIQAHYRLPLTEASNQTKSTIDNLLKDLALI